METSKILSREELGDMYFDLRDKFHSYFSPWSNMLGPQGDPEFTKKQIKEKMDSIEKELGPDFLFACRLKRDILSLEGHLKDQIKNNDELEERVERLEACIVELRSQKKNDRKTLFGEYDSFRHCDSPIPSKASIPSISYRGSLLSS